MPKENQSDGRAHDCDHEQIFCAHGHIHEHRKSRVIGVLMAMCTSKPIIGKRAPGAAISPLGQSGACIPAKYPTDAAQVPWVQVQFSFLSVACV